MILSGAPVFTPVFSLNQSILPLALPLKVRSEVVFGTPSKNCSGNGICMLSQHKMNSTLPGPCPKVPCWMTINTARQAVILEFDLNTLSAAMLEKHFAFSQFLMEEAVRIPLSVSKKWKINGRIQLENGFYPFIQQEDKITLILKYGPLGCH